MSLRHPEHHPVRVALGSGAVRRTADNSRHGLDRDPLGMDYKDHTLLRNAPGIYAVRRPEERRP
jgi:hypothetical protein